MAEEMITNGCRLRFSTTTQRDPDPTKNIWKDLPSTYFGEAD